ncbi:MAG: stage IV sporulation protein A [Clostridia bacterium]|nr:stage IV sporulation protein A [Clostridia bacterium]
MVEYNVYQDIAERTQGDVYIGVVGPVRTGKSTFIKKFMELLVLPNIENDYKRNRAQDELPQSAGGRTIMTTEPKFIPNEAVQISLDDKASFNVRMIDCVGYIVNGAMGHIEDEMPRMVVSPWSDEPIPFEEAAEIGTHKVISEHSTIGIVVTTDGSITEIDRGDYISAEERVIEELKAINKPFVIIMNSASPNSEWAKLCKAELEEKYGAKVIPMNCMTLSKEDIDEIMRSILYEFPICQVGFYMPDWISAMSEDNSLKADMNNAVFDSFGNVSKISDVFEIPKRLMKYDFVDTASVNLISPGKGVAEIKIAVDEKLFYDTVEELTGFSIEDESQLLTLLTELSEIKRNYKKVEDAIRQVNQTGYGIVSPSVDELTLEEPEIMKQGSRFGVRLKASAPSIHMIRADIETEVNPIVGTEKQSEELVHYLLNEFESDPKKIWESNIFGKSLHELVNEGLHNKLCRMPEDARMKIQETLTKIINEGSGGLICIIL